MASPTPHDALFKYVFTRPEEASSLLRSYLPSPVVAATSRHTDLLYACVFADGSKAQLYVVLEHQSGESALMAYRMARYVTRVLDRWLAENVGAKTLPVVVPLVLHHGPRRWLGSPDLRDTYAAPAQVVDTLGPALLSLRFILEDLTSAEDAALGRRALTAFAELTLRAMVRLPQSQDVAADIRGWLELLSAVLRAEDGLARLAAFVNYVRHVAEVDDEALRDVFVNLGPGAEEVVMTAAERLREEGRNEGREQGRNEGREQGRNEGREQGRRAQAARTLLELMSERFGPVPEQAAARVTSAEVELETLERWTRRLLSATTIDEVLELDEPTESS